MPKEQELLVFLCYHIAMSLGHRGMSVIEIVVSLSILAIAALGLIAVMTRLMIAQSTSSHQTVGKLIAESVLQEASLNGPPDFGPLPLGEVQRREARVGQNGELVSYTFTLDADEKLYADSHPLTMNDPAVPKMGVIWEIKVRIWWNEGDAAAGAVERGERSLEVSRLTYVET